MNRSKLIAIGAVCLALTGCAHANNRSPQELLSLSVAGLSGVDRYAFSGETGIGTGTQADRNPSAYQGTVSNHNQVNVQGTGGSMLPSQRNPLELLNEIEAAAVKTEIIPEESTGQRTVLRITTDPKKTAALWSDRLRGEFSLLEKKVPANVSAAPQGQGHVQTQAKPLSPADQSALEAEWNGELAHSRRTLESMLATMQAQSTCKLAIDRKKLLPLSLEERTAFRYQVDGKPVEENRTTRLNFNL
ncbi:hypothetical protein GXP70_18995 [Paenibacillus lycopersici]|uniref:Sporulation protein n=1 Tax=Paenibacillus lycopersici TaxID=2704462 RepID=A0A6C0G2F7_9BACL|nr:hypothetical protein [Paenibacillus lycopersici]QHT61861.1 hypothetical protein GXP70_18995 [Paenibacillus lycopersici]